MQSPKDHFLFVVSRLDYGTHILEPDYILESLADRSLWLLSGRSPHRKRMSQGDRIVFYLSGPKRRHFVVDAVIADSPRTLTSEEAAFCQKIGLTDFPYALPIERIRVWGTPVPIAHLYDDLQFVRDKRYPGQYLRQGVVRLSEGDYTTILTARRTAK